MFLKINLVLSLDNLILLVLGCGGIFTEPQGTLSIPGSPAIDARSVVDCVWTIHAPENYVIQLNWIVNSVPESFSGGGCNLEYIEVLENYRTSEELSLGK